MTTSEYKKVKPVHHVINDTQCFPTLKTKKDTLEIHSIHSGKLAYKVFYKWQHQGRSWVSYRIVRSK